MTGGYILSISEHTKELWNKIRNTEHCANLGNKPGLSSCTALVECHMPAAYKVGGLSIEVTFHWLS